MKYTKLRKSLAVLIILDGFGFRQESKNNAIAQAKTPYWDFLLTHYAHGTINASESMVGLPKGQFGNSEVGHLNLGAGRVFKQDIVRINESIDQYTLKDNPVVQALCAKTQRRIHLLGLFSNGGVHSHIDHFFSLIEVLLQKGAQDIVLHPILDGRDTPPQSAAVYLKCLKAFKKQHQAVKVGVMSGRFYAMDRDRRWQRTKAVYDVLAAQEHPISLIHQNTLDALHQSYQENINDEFFLPQRIDTNTEFCFDDALLFLNFRADRARQLWSALTSRNFAGFPRKREMKWGYIASMTSYGDQYTHPVLFSPQNVENSLGEYFSYLGLRQLRIAETEKYPHVTYFFNGGREAPFVGEERILVPSPKVRTYDLKPEMSAFEVSERLIKAIQSEKFQFVVCNCANADMVGHTGVMTAAVRAIEVLDQCLSKIVPQVLAHGGELIITADHGNSEQMYDEQVQQSHTQHTTNPVPFIYVGEKAQIREGGSLQDVAPSLLTILGLDQPAQMTGHSLIKF